MVTSSSPATQIGGIIRTTVTTTTASESTRHVILVDLQDNGVRLVHAQDNGVRLVHALMACSEAVQTSNLTLAEALIKQIGFLAGSQAGAMRKVAMYFPEALALRIFRLSPLQTQIDQSLSDNFQMRRDLPLPQVAHFTAKQAILFPTNTYLI
ncbi:hypothetical protein F2Q69_00042431 [Brassica cretica]|uniref:DELLA protein n=1 Tax=Brassica cretica TaxID=69181 RepID=A0A8S9NEK6_BRACR|nr:hypothetical protein F2Q69_00042430 [Brassica cretica]KAF3502891.1 hypothetical protein F2Q69_00042431 [Brassica cretica]